MDKDGEKFDELILRRIDLDRYVAAPPIRPKGIFSNR
jgi:hypothetical protein